MSEPLSPAQVEYYHEISGVGSGNIIWAGRFPMRYAIFPKNHPCAPGLASADNQMQFGDSATLRAFRERGYWASCFPEGDGITMQTNAGQTAANVAQDIAECFGWKVTVKRV